MPRRFFDLQVNGYAGVDFNQADLQPESMQRACDALIADGAEGILATVITDSVDAMCKKLDRIADLQQVPIAGIHIEGPFISPEPGFVGAHPIAHAHGADLDSIRRLLDAANGLTRVVTLAPEQDPTGAVTEHLSDLGIIVSAGHCNPTIDELKRAIDHGLSMFTHLGNGCPAHLHRHDNIIQRALSLSDQLTICYIADGAHVPYLALKNYLAVSGLDHSVIVTDAISAAGLGPGHYTLGTQTVEVGDDGVVWSADRSHFVGSACTMPQAINNLEEELGLSSEEINQLVYSNPLRAINPHSTK